MKNKLVLSLIGIIVILIVVFGIWFLMKQQEKAIVVNSASAATVQITPDGFVPETVIIRAGQSVEWMNTDTKLHQVAPDPHPLHSSFTPLAGTDPLQSRENMSFRYPKKGTYPYHDEADPLHKKGIVVVK